MKKNDFPFNAIRGYAWKVLRTLCIIPHIWKNDILETHDMKTHEQKNWKVFIVMQP